MDRSTILQLPPALRAFLRTEWGFTALAFVLWLPVVTVGSTFVLAL